MADELKDNDLPLVSNVKDILVKHYIFNFSCSFEERCFTCTMLIYLEPITDKTESVQCVCSQNNFKETKKDCISSVVNLVTTENDTKERFMLILDCHKILIHDVEEISLTDSEKDNVMYKGYNPTMFCATKKLNFCTDKWSLKIWTDSCFCKFCFPTFIRISYQTIPEGSSLLWVTDQDKKPAVFTYGAWINNRSLYPCQEPPSAMATWEATVSVDNSAVVLMSGDEDARITMDKGRTYFYYFTKSVLPLSTLCLAIGFWQEHAIASKHRSGPKCRIFSPPSLIDKSVQELFEYAPYCLKISEDVFGPYPFPRIDFLIVPPTFGSLGMASPNIVFLSQSLLTGDYSMCSRVAHEIAHGWFGLLIGASDWTEEWLSEGFATFVEDYFHVYTMNMSESEARDYIEIKTYIRLRTLLQEISNTNEELQVLRPNKGETVTEAVDGVSATVVQNGQNPIKAFIQVHYIKGYFLLKHLANIVGIESFLAFLKGYIEKYRGKLVTSIDFLSEFISWFASTRLELTLEQIYEKWLHNADVPAELKCMKPSPGNKIYLEAMTESKKWQLLNSFYLKQKKRRKYDLENFATMTSEQLVLILENLLDEPTISMHTLAHLNEHFTFDSANAEVQHRWFELVVKYRCKPCYDKLRNFLTQHLAMGVYLFGEMFFSKDPRLRRMAEESYLAMKHEMEPSFVSTLEQMLQDA